MSIAAARRRPWMLPAGIGLAVAAVASVALLVLWKHQQTHATSSPFGVAPAAQQAPWHVKTVAAGALTHIAKADRLAVEKQGRAIAHVVEGVFDAQYLHEGSPSKILHASFTGGAAAAFDKAGFGVPKGATNVKTTTRAARIGVDAAGARSASAHVTISLTGGLKGEHLRLTQQSTLWMQRIHGRWRVVGYDATQGPSTPGAGRRAKGALGAKGK